MFQLTSNVTRDQLVIINSYDDMVATLRRYPYETERSRDFAAKLGDLAGELRNVGFDFEAMARDGYAGMWLTAEGNWQCHLPFDKGPGLPPDMNAWDCETILWFRWAFSSWKEVTP